MSNPIAKMALGFMNHLCLKAVGGENRPVFFDAETVYPPLKELDAHFAEIRDELVNLLRQEQLIPTYHQLDRRQTSISAGDPNRSWKIFLLYAMGEKPELNRSKCPKTARLIDQIPGLFQAYFSILDPGKSIPAHEGPYLGFIRYHLPLIVPENRPPQIRIKDRVHTWKEGQGILFDDTWNHEVMNSSDSTRVVLSVDVLRPLPLALHAMNLLYKRGFRLAYAKGMVKKMGEFETAARL